MPNEINIKIYTQLLKIALFAIFIYLFYRLVLVKIDPEQVLNTFKQSNTFFLLGAFIFMALRFITLSLKFQFAANGYSIKSSFRSFLFYEFKLLFMEFIIPMPNAEDIFRILFLKLKDIPFSKCLNVILAMRVTGMITLSFLLMGLLLYTGSLIVNYPPNIIYTILIVLLIVLVSHRFWLIKLSVLLKKPLWLNNLIHKMILDKFSLPNYLALISISFIHYFFSAVVVYFLLRSFGAELNILILLTIVPIMALSFLIPLSVQGLGMPEAALLFILIKLKIPEEIASAVSITHLLCFISFIFLGGIFFFFDKSYSLDFFKKQMTSLKGTAKGSY